MRLQGKQFAAASIDRGKLDHVIPSERLVVFLNGGAQTTTSTSFVDITGLSLTFTPRAGETVLVLAHLCMSHTAGTGTSLMGSADIAHNNSGSFVRLFGGEGGRFGEFATTFFDWPNTLAFHVTMPNAVSTTVKGQFRTGGGTARVHAADTTTTGARAHLHVVRF